MGTDSTTNRAADVLEKVAKLIALTENDSEEEARTSALTAARLIRENDLTVVSKSDLEEIKKATEDAKRALARAERAEKKGQQNMIIGALAGAFLAKRF